MTPLLWAGPFFSLYLLRASGLPWLSLSSIKYLPWGHCTEACTMVAQPRLNPGHGSRFSLLILTVVSGLSQTPVWSESWLSNGCT